MGAFDLSLPLRRVGPFCNEIPAAGRRGRRGRGGEGGKEGGRGGREGGWYDFDRNTSRAPLLMHAHHPHKHMFVTVLSVCNRH